MYKIAFIIDGKFMRKRVYELKLFYYNPSNVQKYCFQYLGENDKVYKIFYYDAEPFMKKVSNPISKKIVNFNNTQMSRRQIDFFKSCCRTGKIILRLGKSTWYNKQWIIKPYKLGALINSGNLKEQDIYPRIETKSVDIKIGLDVANIALNHLADTLIVITGDSRIIPALTFAREKGMRIGLDPMNCPVDPRLRKLTDFTKTFAPSHSLQGQRGR